MAACTGHLMMKVFLLVVLPQFLTEAGFCNVLAEDRTAQFIQVIETELKRAEAIKEEFIEVQLHHKNSLHL